MCSRKILKNNFQTLEMGQRVLATFMQSTEKEFWVQFVMWDGEMWMLVWFAGKSGKKVFQKILSLFILNVGSWDSGLVRQWAAPTLAKLCQIGTLWRTFSAQGRRTF